MRGMDKKPIPEPLRKLFEREFEKWAADYFFGQGSDEPYGACFDPGRKRPKPQGLAKFLADKP